MDTAEPLDHSHGLPVTDNLDLRKIGEYLRDGSRMVGFHMVDNQIIYYSLLFPPLHIVEELTHLVDLYRVDECGLVGTSDYIGIIAYAVWKGP